MQILAQLKADIIGLRFPLRSAPKPPPVDVIGMRKHLLRPGNQTENMNLSQSVRRASVERMWSDRPCSIITRNPLNKILIRFEATDLITC